MPETSGPQLDEHQLAAVNHSDGRGRHPPGAAISHELARYIIGRWIHLRSRLAVRHQQGMCIRPPPRKAGVDLAASLRQDP